MFSFLCWLKSYRGLQGKRPFMRYSHRPCLERLEDRLAPSITQLTFDAGDHRWPSMNNQGDYVYSAQVGGLWQIFKDGHQVTSNSYNNMFPSISDNGDMVFFRDGGSSGVGWQVIRRSSSGGESTIEFSSRNSLSGAHRDANEYSGIASDGTSISGYNFYSSSGTFFSPTQRFDVSGYGQLAFDFSGSYNYPDINAQGDLLFAGTGFFNSGDIYKTTTSGPFPGTPVASESMGRINDSGDIVSVSGDLNSPGRVNILNHSNYNQSTFVSNGSWADINNNDEVIFENADAQGMHQLYLYKNDTDIAILSAQLQSGNTVQFTYQTTGNPGPFQVGLYRSADTAFDLGVDPLVQYTTVTPNPTNPQSPGILSTDPLSLASFDPDLPYLLVVADPTNAIAETDETNNRFSLYTPDIVAKELDWHTNPATSGAGNGGGVDLSYDIVNANLPTPASIALYWAHGTTFDPTMDVLAYQFSSNTAVGSYSKQVTASQLADPWDGTNGADADLHLLLVVNAPTPDHPNGTVMESDSTNDVKDLFASPDSILAPVINAAGQTVRSVEVSPPAGAKITATFRPAGGALTLKQAATICGVDHFNWLQTMSIPSSPDWYAEVWTGVDFPNPSPDARNPSVEFFRKPGTSGTSPDDWVVKRPDGSLVERQSASALPLQDPAVQTPGTVHTYAFLANGQWGVTNHNNFDGQPYYFEEEPYILPGYYYREQYVDPIGDGSNAYGLGFVDMPMFRNGSFASGEFLNFNTKLAGVSVSGGPNVWSGIGTNFSWTTNAVFAGSGAADFRSYFAVIDQSNLPPLLAGGVFDVRYDDQTLATVVTVASDHPSGSTYGQSATLSVTVSSAVSSMSTPTGVVQFDIDGNPFGSPITLVNGSASLTTGTLTAGTHTITAFYTSDSGRFNNSDNSAAPFTQTVSPALLTVTADDQTRVYGQANPPLSFQLSGFVNGDTSTVLSGALTLATPATATSPIGPYPITVAPGTLTAANYTFAFVNGTLTVNPAATGTALDAPLLTPLAGVDTVALTASVTVMPPGSGTPTGSVDFFDTTTGTDLGTTPLSGGTATLTLPPLAAGLHILRATYSGDGNFLSSSGTLSLTALVPASLSGSVFADFNDDGQVDFGENGIAGVLITLAGTDDLGNAVTSTQTTDSNGVYTFANLRPGSYTITETQPAGYNQGIDTVGTWSGVALGSLSADQFSISFSSANYPTTGTSGINYNFGERPAATGPVQAGQTAGIGFWNNKNGQALILALNGGTGTELGDWLAATLPNLYGQTAGSHNLAGKSNADIAAFYHGLFAEKGPKLDAQVLATALSVYVTNAALDPTKVAAQYGFTVSGDGLGTATVNVGSNGDAFGVANNTTLTVMDLLLATDAQAVMGVLYNGNKAKWSEANAVYSALNDAGDIG